LQNRPSKILSKTTNTDPFLTTLKQVHLQNRISLTDPGNKKREKERRKEEKKIGN